MPPTSSLSGSPEPTLAKSLTEAFDREGLPVGRDGLTEPLIDRSQRERILISIAASCAKRGYGATTVADICESASVSRATFYQLFKDKEDCFHAAMEVSVAEAMGDIAAVYSPDKPWPEMVRDATAAILELLASRPDFARMALAEAPTSGERGYRLYTSCKRVLQWLLDRGRPDSVEDVAIPYSASHATLAAAESLVVGQILAGNTARLPELLPDIVYITTVPYLGREEALRQAHEAEKATPTADA